MRVLVATSELQGHLDGDYAFTVEGELVTADVSECASPERCGCGRGFPGLASSRATTTAMVVDLPHLTPLDLRVALCDWLDRSGWTDLFRAADAADDGFASEFDDVDEMLDAVVDEHIDIISTICHTYPTGTVVERSGTLVRARSVPSAA